MPSNVSLGNFRAALPADTCVFAEAAAFAASQVVEQCFASHADSHVASQTIVSSHVANTCATMSTATHDCPRAHISRAQPAQQGFDLSVLAPYLETSEVHRGTCISSCAQTFLQPLSEGYFQKLIAAFELSLPAYAHVPRSILPDVKSLLRKYQHVFIFPTLCLLLLQVFPTTFLQETLPPFIICFIARAQRSFQLSKQKLNACLNYRLSVLVILLGRLLVFLFVSL